MVGRYSAAIGDSGGETECFTEPLWISTPSDLVWTTCHSSPFNPVAALFWRRLSWFSELSSTLPLTTTDPQHEAEKPDPDWQWRRDGLRLRLPACPRALRDVLVSGGLLILFFWIAALWLYGSFNHTSTRLHQLTIHVADFDGGSVGSALLSAARQTTGSNVPTFKIVPANSTTPAQLQKDLFDGKVWGVIWATEGATARFEAAVGSQALATVYDPRQALMFSGLEVRYGTIWSTFLSPPIRGVCDLAAQLFALNTGAPGVVAAIASNSSLSLAQSKVLVAPVSSTFINLTPFTFGSLVMLNTVGTVLPVLFQLFFIFELDRILGSFNLYRTHLLVHFESRLPLSFVWTVLTSLCSTGWSLAFDEGMHLPAKNFFALWAVTWVYTMILFDYLDALAVLLSARTGTIVVSVLWINLSVAATINPIELLNPFFRIHYAFPAHSYWETVITIFGRGACNHLSRDLPILAAWLAVGKAFWIVGLLRRARDASSKAKPPEL